MSETIVNDDRGVRVQRGSHVSTDGPLGVGDYPGLVTCVTDPDGEPDGETGVMRGINPSVTVLWPDGDSETFSTHWLARGPWDDDAPYEVVDLQVLDPKTGALAEVAA